MISLYESHVIVYIKPFALSFLWLSFYTCSQVIWWVTFTHNHKWLTVKMYWFQLLHNLYFIKITFTNTTLYWIKIIQKYDFYPSAACRYKLLSHCIIHVHLQSCVLHLSDPSRYIMRTLILQRHNHHEFYLRREL